MLFARRHYIVLARALRQARKKALTPREARGILHVLDAVCEALELDNEEFSRNKFAEAFLDD